MLKSQQDAFGQALYDRLRGDDAVEAIERDDGYIEAGPGAQYLADYRRWPGTEKQAMQFVRGRVLDVGCGAGRVCLYLQQHGFRVVGIDNSPLAVRVSRRRGVRCVYSYSISDLRKPLVQQRLGRFDTIVMMGNNLGLLGSFSTARRLLAAFRAVTNLDAQIVATTLNPYGTKKPVHHAYHTRNRRRGRMAGQIRMRIRYSRLATPWFDYLLVSRPELEAILAGTGWKLSRTISPEDGTYAVIITRAEYSGVRRDPTSHQKE